MQATRADLPLAAPPGWRGWTLSKLRHAGLTWAFCIAVAVLQVAFMPERPLLPTLVYSLCIGTVIWAVVDLGRHGFPSARDTGWPGLLPGLALVLVAIVAGYLGGSFLGDLLCRAFGLYAAGGPAHTGDDTRTGLLISATAGIVGSYYFYSINRGQYLERKAAEAQRHADEARLKLLETQLEPHMLFNTLANLRALIGVDPPRAQRMLDHMIAYLRATLDGSRAATHPLEAEFGRLRDYLSLMAIRMGPRLAYELVLPPVLAARRVPTLLLQPLVENAIQHGLEPRVEGGRLTVTASDDDGALVLEVRDTGVGPGPLPSGSGFGLSQVRERLATLHGAAARLDFGAADGGGTRVRIVLPPPAA